jgi:polyribonucleotide nucleotidyltransferase
LLTFQAVRTGHDAIKAMCTAIEGWAAQVGKPKRTDDLLLPPEGLDEAVHGMIGAEVRNQHD